MADEHLHEDEVLTDPQETDETAVTSDEESESEETEQETTESEETEQESEETEETEESDEVESYLEDEEYLKQKGFYEKGLPGHIKNLDEAIQYGLAMADQAQKGMTAAEKLARVNEILARQGISGGVDAFIAGGGVSTPPTPIAPTSAAASTGQKVLPDKPFSDIVEAMIQTGEIAQNDQPWYRRLGKSIDHALSQVSQPLLQGVAVTANEMLALRDKVRDLEWKTMPTKVRQTAPRHELDALINSGQARDYEEAAFMWLRKNRSDLLSIMLGRKQSTKGSMEHQRFARPRSLGRKPRKKEPIKRKFPYGEFLNPDGTVNEELLEKKFPGKYDKQIEIIEKIQKEALGKRT